MLPKPQLTARNKSASRKSKPSGFYHATVTRVVQPVRKTHFADAIIDSPSVVTASTDALIGSVAANTLRPDVYIRVPRLAAQFEFGPVEYVGAPPSIGDKVWATFKEGRQDELAIIVGSTDAVESSPAAADSIVDRTYTVAASNSLDEVKAAADFVCVDGSAQDGIKSAFDAGIAAFGTSEGFKIALAEGDYNCDQQLLLTGAGGESVQVEGAGDGATKLVFTFTDGTKRSTAMQIGTFGRCGVSDLSIKVSSSSTIGCRWALKVDSPGGGYVRSVTGSNEGIIADADGAFNLSFQEHGFYGDINVTDDNEGLGIYMGGSGGRLLGYEIQSASDGSGFGGHGVYSVGDSSIISGGVIHAIGWLDGDGVYEAGTNNLITDTFISGPTGNGITVTAGATGAVIGAYRGVSVGGSELSDSGTNTRILVDQTHNIASHPDTTATGTELNTLTDGSNADSLHAHVSDVTVRKNTGADVGTRPRLNFIEGSNVTLTIADDAVGDEVDITITSTAGGGSPLTTKGDLYGYDSADARVPVGTDGDFLKADSADAQGVVWATLAESDISDLAHEITVRKNTGADVGTRPRLNFIEGSNVTLTIADDAGGGEVDITIAASGAASPLTTKGDLFGYDTGDARIPVGTDGDFLKADSADAQGIVWASLAESDISDLAHEITVRKNTGADVGTRARLNFIEGSNVTLTIADDAGSGEVDITIAATGSSSTLTTKGDLHGYDTGDARIPVGSDDQVLVADSSDAQGIVWGAVPAHASRHSDGGADEITVSNLGSGAAADGDLLASDGAGGLEFVTPSNNLLGESVLTSSAASITIDLPAAVSDYDDLMIVGRFRSDHNVTDVKEDQIRVRVGGTSVDTGSNYDFAYRQFRKDTATTNVNQGDAATSFNIGYVSATADSTAGVYGIAEMTILSFGSTSAERNLRFSGGVFNATADYWTNFGGIGVWKNNTTAIDKIQFYPVNGTNLVSGTQVRVYGLPASGTGTGGGGTTSPLTTKGDLWGYGTDDMRIPVGTNDHVLTADSTQSSGVKWAAAAGSGSGNLAAIVVAASDALQAVKDAADYTCDGTADEVQINNAITDAQNDATNGSGGRVILVGKYFDIDDPIKMKHGVWLQGSGLGTIIRDESVTAGDGMIEVNAAQADYLTKVSDLTLWGNYAAGGSGHGIKIDNTGGYTGTYQPGNSPDSSHIVENVFIARFTGAARHGLWVRNNTTGATRDNKFVNIRMKEIGGNGFFIDNSSDNKFVNCIVQGPAQQGAGYAGFRVNGASNQFTNCKAAFSDDMGWYITSARNSFVNCHAQDCDYEGWVCNGTDCSFVNIIADSNLAADSAGTFYAIDINASDQWFQGVMMTDRDYNVYNQNRGVHFGTNNQIFFEGYWRPDTGGSANAGTPGTNSKVFIMKDGTTPYEFPYAAHDESHTIASHSDTTATGAELNELTDGSTSTLHAH